MEVNPELYLNKLKDSPHFEAVPESHFNFLAREGQSTLRFFETDQPIFRIEDTRNILHFIIDGTVYVWKPTNKPNLSLFISRRIPGSVIGELELLTQGGPAGAVVAATDVVTLEVEHDHFKAFLKRFPAFEHEMSVMLAKKLRDTIRHFESLVIRSAAGRIVDDLLFLISNKVGTKEDSVYTIPFGSQKQLASYLDIDEAVVSRTFGEWEKKGILERKSGQLIIRDKYALLAYRDK